MAINDSDEFVQNTIRKTNLILNNLSEEQRKLYETDAKFRTKITIQSIKQVEDEMVKSIKVAALTRNRIDAENRAAEYKAYKETQEKKLKALEEERASIIENSNLSEREKKLELQLNQESMKGVLEHWEQVKRKQEDSEKAAKVYQKTEEKMLGYREVHQRKLRKLEDDLSEKQIKTAQLRAAYETAEEWEKEGAKKELEEAEKEEQKARNALAAEELGESLKKSLTGALDKLTNAVDSSLTSLAGYQSGMMARLQGSNSDFDDMVNLVRQNLRGNPLLKQKDVLDNLQKLTDKGIAYDLEQRAFLATVSNKIATTFDALDGTLTRLIRLQQADTTAARLGLEANLTRMLNAMFSDTSYLSDVYDSVSSAILDANSQLSRENSVAFEYTVQKWLGALYSLGASSNMVESIAKGINLLGTGDVSALAGNETLQTLLAMSASKAGLPYAELLIDGLDSSETNKLLRGMFEYLKEIAENSDNQVVKAAYGNIFGLSLSDIAAIQNLSQGEIENIFSQTLDYGGAMSELTYQLGQVASRVPLGERIKNVFDNAMFSVASSIFESAPQYVTYMITDAINQVTGGIPIPSPFVFGTGFDLSGFTVEGIIKNAIVGINLLGQIGPILGNMMSSDGTSLWSWGGEPGYNTRGSEFINIRSGAQRSTSSSTYIGSRSSSDMKSSSISSAFEEGNEIKSASGQDEEEFVKAAPALDKGGAELWSKWVNGIAEKFEEKPLAVKIMSAESTIPVVMVLGGSGTDVEANYTMMDLIKAVVDSHDVGTGSFKVSSTDNMINQVNGYLGGE